MYFGGKVVYPVEAGKLVSRCQRVTPTQYYSKRLSGLSQVSAYSDDCDLYIDVFY